MRPHREEGEPTPEEMGIEANMKSATSSVEHELTRTRPADFLLDIYNTKEKKDVGRVRVALDAATKELQQLENVAGKQTLQENVDWLLNNNNRIDLYQITAVLNGEEYEGADEEMDVVKAKQFFAYRKTQAALLTAGEIEDPEGVRVLVNFINENPENSYLCETAIDSLAKNAFPEARDNIREIADDEKYGFEFRTRAVLAGLRAGMSFDSANVSALANEYIETLGDQLCQTRGTYTLIEIAGLLEDHFASAVLLDELNTRMQHFPEEQRQWFERDIISTRLAVRMDDRNEYFEGTLGTRQYVADNGIVFGSLNPEIDFADFLSRNREKCDKMAEVIERLNNAFHTEPILYVDIHYGDADEAGWTQNSIYFSSGYIERSDEVTNILQTAGHEACERWQSKGFFDVQLSKLYLQLMGEQYAGSQLDNFRLKHRLQGKSNSGHPWDGEREFIAELGSTLLVDPTVIERIFDPKTDQTALEALEYLKTKVH